MLFTKQLIFNSLITAKSLSLKYSKAIIILTSLSAQMETRGKTTKSKERREGKGKKSWKISLWKNNNELIYTSTQT